MLSYVALDCIITRAPEASLSSILITFSSPFLQDSGFVDCLCPMRGSVLPLLSSLDVPDVILLEISVASDEILDTSERGDLIDSLFGWAVKEALMDLGMHFNRMELASSL